MGLASMAKVPAAVAAARVSLGGDPELTFNPHYVKCVFKDSRLRMRIGLVVLLPSGVNGQEMLKSKVMPDGRNYCLDALMPDVAVNPDKFLHYIRFFAMEQCGGEHTAAKRLDAFHEVMSTMRPVQNAPVWRQFKLELDFAVVEDIAYTKLMTFEGCFFLYVEFLAQERNSYMHGDGIIEGDVVDLNKCFLKKAPK
jgi:hypothetical protein